MQCSQIKKQQRHQFLTARKAIPNVSIRLMSEQICASVLHIIQQGEFRRVLLYSPIKGEPDVSLMLDTLLKSGMEIAFPISDTKNIRLTFRKVESHSDLAVGAYGILEPREYCSEISDFSDTLCMVPALAIDRQGFRLGYGKGYYDRFLPTLYAFGGTSLCPVYRDFLCDSLTHEDTDISVDIICTQKEVIYTHHENKIQLLGK